MIRSSYIEWLLEQQWRTDEVGELARWVIAEPEFVPLELHDILDRCNDTMKIIAFESFVEFAENIPKDKPITTISENDIDQERLNIAVSHENYEEAAKLRDKLNQNNIEFSIGPKNKEQHIDIMEWLNKNGYKIQHISNTGDHYSDIMVKGDFNKFAERWEGSNGLSYEHWQED